MVEATSIFPKKNRVDLIREEAGKGKRSDRRREWSVSLAWSGTRRISQDRSELEELGEAMEAARKVGPGVVGTGGENTGEVKHKPPVSSFALNAHSVAND